MLRCELDTRRMSTPRFSTGPQGSRGESARTGLLGGWALGILEACLVVAIARYEFPRLYDWVLIPLAPVLVYGVLGAVLGALVRPRASTWWILAVLAAAWIVRAHTSEALERRWFAPLIALALSLPMLWLLHRVIPRTAGPRLVGFATLAAIAVPLLAWAAGDQLDLPRFSWHPEPSSAPRADGPNVCLVTWDTVRADTLPAFGGGGLDTPELDRLIREGVLLDRFQAVASTTAPAHMSMLAGLYPNRHGLRSNGDTAPELELPRLPELFGAAGYATGAFVSNFVLRPRFGFDRGFDHFDTGEPGALMRVLARLGAGSALVRRLAPDEFVIDALNAPGSRTVERALAWVRSVDRPAFLWVHFYDAHYPYRPPDAHRARVLARAGEGPHAVDPAAEEALLLQRGEIEELDHLLGELRRGLEERDPGLVRTWIVLAADHGECFGEGGIKQHHRSLFRATQHVIGAIRPPETARDFPRGVRVSAPASQVDLYPTICKLTGLAAPDGLQGIDLVPLIRGAPAPARGLYMETFQNTLGDERMHGWWEDGWKYVRKLDGRELVLEDGAQGEIDRSAEEGARGRALRARLDEYLQLSSPVAIEQRPLNDQDQRALKQLGYTGDD